MPRAIAAALGWRIPAAGITGANPNVYSLILAWLTRRWTDDRPVLLVGHNPDLPQLVHDLTGARVELKKGGVAGVQLSGRARGELVALLRPRELERLR